MDEAVGEFAVVAPARQQAVAAGEQFLEAEQRGAEVVGGVVVVVQVDLDLAEAGAAEVGQGVEVFRLVLLDGVEERVARRPAVGVAEAAELPRVVADPALDAAAADLRRPAGSASARSGRRRTAAGGRRRRGAAIGVWGSLSGTMASQRSDAA